jgi:SET domain-containing protein
MSKRIYIKKKRFPLYTDKSEHHGKGIFARKPIEKGSVFVGESYIPAQSKGYNWSSNPNAKLRKHNGENCVEFTRDIKPHEEITVKKYIDRREHVERVIERDLKTKGCWESIDGRTGKVTRRYKHYNEYK